MVVSRWVLVYFAKSLVLPLAVCAAQIPYGQAAQQPDAVPVQPAAPQTQQAPQNPASIAAAGGEFGSTASGPIAIVSLDSKDPASAAMVTGALQVANGKAMISTNGAITAGSNTTDVTLPRRGILRVCASTTVKLASDVSVPKGEVPGLMMVIDHGAVEASPRGAIPTSCSLPISAS